MHKTSVKLKAVVRKYRLSEEEIAFADLVYLGWVDRDAYQIAGLYDESKSTDNNWQCMRRLLISKKFLAYTPYTRFALVPKKELDNLAFQTANNIVSSSDGEMKIDANEKRKRIKKISDEEVQEALSKDNQLRELLFKLRNEDLTQAEELKVRQMIADITQAKHDKLEMEEELTSFYLPPKCYMCNLYIHAKEKMESEALSKQIGD